MIWDRHTKGEGKRREERQWKKRKKPFTSGKDSDRKPPICGQIAVGPARVDPISMSVSMCVYWLVVNRWGWRTKAKSLVWNAGCHKMSSPHQAIQDRTFWDGNRQLTCWNNCPHGSTQQVRLWQVPQPPLIPQCFHFPATSVRDYPLTAPEVCVEDEKFRVYRYMAHWHRLKRKLWPGLLNEAFWNLSIFMPKKGLDGTGWFDSVHLFNLKLTIISIQW